MGLLVNQSSAEEYAENTVDAQETTSQQFGNRKITGVIYIDQSIRSIYPEIDSFSVEEIQIIEGLIREQIFGEDFIIPIIQEKTNSIVADFIEGIGIIAIDNDITDYQGIKDFFDAIIDDIPESGICKI